MTRTLTRLILLLTLLVGGMQLKAQNWQIVWQDEFNTSIGPDWVFETGAGGWGNNELEYYRQENASVQNGNLVMTAKRESFGGANYTSVRMKTQGRKSWKYGKIEARIAMPSFQGIWPAFWMLGDNIGAVGWPKCGEIDIMEHVNTGTEVVGTIHWDNGGHQEYGNRTNTDNLNNYHTYGVEWNKNEIKWFIDGRQYHVANIANNINGTEEFQNNFFILLNLAVGGNWPGFNIDNNQFPTSMLVDYVRVYQDNGVPPINASTGIVTAYKDCNYTGFSGGFDIGEYNLTSIQAKGVLDNDISSFRVAQGFKVIAYENDNFSGASTTITSDMGCSADWNDRISSFRVLSNGLTNMAGTYTLQNRNSNLNLDVRGGTGATGDGARMQQWNVANTTNQQFKFEHLNDGAYKVTAVHSGKVLDIDAVKKDDGAYAQQWAYFGSLNQQWIVVAADGGSYKLIAKHSGKVLEVAGASTQLEAQVQQWTNNNQICGQWKFNTLVTNPPVDGTGDGLTGNYFNGMNFETPVYSRKDATISFDWGNGSPNAAVNADQFSARWTGQVQPKYSGVYTFYLNSDNGRRLWVNGQLIIDKWIDDWNIDYSGTITLTANQKYDIKIEYFENNGGAAAKLEWSHASQTREVVPTKQLYSNNLPAVSITTPVNNATYNSPASIGFASTASDNGSVAKVEYYNGATKIGESSTGNYAITWSNVAVGTYTITARATDNLGGVTVSSAITVKVNQGTTNPTNQAPTVSLTAPSNGASYNAPASITISANASDADGTISKVEFYNGGTKLGEDATAPYNFVWSSVVAGTYTISAKAFDDKGASATSGSVSVTVKTVVTDVCSSLPTYVEAGGYVAGSKVKNAGKQYECREWPYSGWCNAASWAYAPGTGAYWTDAWYEKGSCSARGSEEASVSSASSSEELLIAPNPVLNELTLQSNMDMASGQVRILNSLGVEVASVGSYTKSIDVSSLPSGTYTLLWVGAGKTISRHFVK